MCLVTFPEYVEEQTIEESQDLRAIRSLFRRLDTALMVDLTFHRSVNRSLAKETAFLFLNNINQRIFGKQSRNVLGVFPVLRKRGNSIKGIYLVIEDPSSFNDRNTQELFDNFKTLLRYEWDYAHRLTADPHLSQSSENSWMSVTDNPERAVVDLWNTIRRQSDDVLWAVGCKNSTLSNIHSC